MKEIRYRGGVITFNLPESWQEEHYRDGGAAFFGNSEATGILNLSLTTAQCNDGEVQEAHLRGTVASGIQPGDPPCEKLSNGNYLQKRERSQVEDGKRLHITFWAVANAVPPKTIRYAVFGLAIPVERAGSPEHAESLRMLDEQIRRVKFTSLAFEKVQRLTRGGRRPWWRFW